MMNGEHSLSIAAAARAIGVSRQTLWGQVRSGAVRSHDGRVYLSEVKADRKRNVDPARAPTMGRTRRGRRASTQTEAPDAPDVPAMFETLDSQEWLVMNALAHSDADPVHLDDYDYPDFTVSRADARAIIAAYRDWNRAVFQRRESGKRELAAIRALHRRLGVPDELSI